MKDRTVIPMRDRALEMLMEDVMQGLHDYVLAVAAAGGVKSAEIIPFEDARQRLAAKRQVRR